MTAINGYIQMTAVESKLVMRDVSGVLLPTVMPLLIIAMNGMGGGASQPVAELGGLSPLSAIYTPSALVMVLTILGMVNVPSFLTAYRHEGVLRRLSVTPANPAMVLAAQVVVNLALALVGITVAMVFAVFAFDVVLPRAILWTVAALILLAASTYAVGLLLAALAPSVNGVMAIGLVLFLGTMALGGGMLPAESMPTALARIGEFTPFGSGLAAMRAGWAGNAPELLHVLVMVGYTVLAGAGSVRFFRWQ